MENYLTTTIEHKFVDSVPDQMEDGILYISLVYATAIHKCCCGCGKEVVTPFSPSDWELVFNGESVSLYPSIGNWSFDCQSHYWIRKNKIYVARKWFEKVVDDKKLNFNKKRKVRKKK